MHRVARWTLLAVGGVGLTVVIVSGIGAGGLRVLRRGACRADELASVPAPGGRLRAVVLQHDCGATGSTGREVAILEAEERVSVGTDPFLGFGAREQPDPNAPWVTPRLRLVWTAADTLIVHTNSRVWHDAPPTRVKGVTVLFSDL